MFERLSRLRRSPGLRQLFAETRLDKRDFILPVFVREGLSGQEEISSMPGVYRFGLTSLPDLVERVHAPGIGGVLLFGLPATKDAQASSAIASNSVVTQAIKVLKKAGIGVPVITDVCVCSYTDHGHCGLLKGGEIDQIKTPVLLGEMALRHAEAGADIVAPSSMVDGQVAAIRQRLDEGGFSETAILGYGAKFASGFYGPFREAADSAPAHGDRKSYQYDPANASHALREVKQDIKEGADAVLIKPGMPYLDILAQASQLDVPTVVYQVSGEYAMIKAAGERGWLNERDTVLESLLAFKRAGASAIITYFALEAAEWIR